jgi:hypothetical protein
MNRSRWECLLILLAVSLCSCTAFDVKTDHDPTADFSKFRTFAFVGLVESDKGGPYDNSLMNKRIESAVVRELTNKGLQQVEVNQQPDLLVHYWISVKEKQRIESGGTSVGVVHGRGGYGWGAGYGGGVTTYEYKQGTLILDLVEPAKKELLWRATIVGTLEDTAKENIELGNKAIMKAFENYPPKKDAP